jgi:hypothetical protein
MFTFLLIVEYNVEVIRIQYSQAYGSQGTQSGCGNFRELEWHGHLAD